MSGQAKRSRILAAQRKRRRVARVIASLEAKGDARRALALDLLAELAQGFDVHRAREHALALVRGYADNVCDRRRCDLGLLVLAAIDGQPSECQVCKADPFDCVECVNTGHNLHGTLAPIEWNAQGQRKAVEAHDYALRRTIDGGWSFPAHLRLALVAGKAANVGATRVVPRGHHRGGLSRISARPENETARAVCSLDERISSREWSSTYLGPTSQSGTMPRWRRGELNHAHPAAGVWS